METTTVDMGHDGRVVVPVDIEHSGIRLAGCFGFVFAIFFFISLGNVVVPDGGLLIILVSVLLASGATYGIDWVLKGRWLSGRELVMERDAIRLKQGEKVERLIERGEPTTFLAWRFEVKRTGRVKKGWHVVACAVEQDGVYLPIYTFCSPEMLEGLPDREQFIVLEARPKGENERDMKLAGQQKRLHDAETVRGMEGGELTYEHFCDYLAYLKRAQWTS